MINYLFGSNGIYISLGIFLTGITIWIIKYILKKREERKKEYVKYLDKKGKNKFIRKEKIYKQNEKIRKQFYKIHDVSHNKREPAKKGIIAPPENYKRVK